MSCDLREIGRKEKEMGEGFRMIESWIELVGCRVRESYKISVKYLSRICGRVCINREIKKRILYLMWNVNLVLKLIRSCFDV